MEKVTAIGGRIRAQVGLRTALVVAAISLTAWLGLYPDRFHGLDVHQFTASLAHDHLHHANHLLYLRLAGPPAILLHDRFGLRLDQGLAIVSAIGVAIAVGATAWTASLLGHGRTTAILAAALVATAPGVTWFANVPEVHGAFLGFAGLAFVGWAWLERAPSAGRGAVLGALTALAAGVHATGHLLVPLLGLMHLGPTGGPESAKRSSRSTMAMAVAVAATTWAAGTWLLHSWLGSGDAGRPGMLAFALSWLGDGRSPSQIAAVLANEWLLPFAPLAMLALAAAARRRTRPATAAVALATLGYVTAAVMLLDGGWSERGAYLLPLAIPYALLAAAHMPRPLTCVGVLVAAVFGATAFDGVAAADPERTAAEDAWAIDLTAALSADPRPAVVVTGFAAESDGIIRVAPKLTFLPAYELLGAVAAETGRGAGTPELTDWFLDRAAALDASRTRLWLTASAVHVLTSLDADFAGTVARHYRMEPIVRGSFRGFVLRQDR